LAPFFDVAVEDQHAALRRAEPRAQRLEFKRVEFTEELIYGTLKKTTD
jgi:hypothetical protein